MGCFRHPGPAVGLDPRREILAALDTPSRSVLPVVSRALVFAGRYRLHTWPHSLGVQDAVQVVDHVSYQTSNPAGAIHRLMGGVDYAFEVAGQERCWWLAVRPLQPRGII